MKVTIDERDITLSALCSTEKDVSFLYQSFRELCNKYETAGYSTVLLSDIAATEISEQDDLSEENKPLKNLDFIDLNQVDSAGVTWDSKIHAKLKTKNKNGTWRLASQKDTSSKIIQDFVEPPQSIIPPPPPVLQNISANVPNTANNFNDFMKIINDRIKVSKTLTMEQILEVIVPFGFNNLYEISKSPEAIPILLDQLNSICYI